MTELEPNNEVSLVEKIKLDFQNALNKRDSEWAILTGIAFILGIIIGVLIR